MLQQTSAELRAPNLDIGAAQKAIETIQNVFAAASRTLAASLWLRAYRAEQRPHGICGDQQLLEDGEVVYGEGKKEEKSSVIENDERSKRKEKKKKQKQKQKQNKKRGTKGEIASSTDPWCADHNLFNLALAP